MEKLSFFKHWYERELYTFAPRLGFYLLPTRRFGYRYKYLFLFSLYGFRKEKELYPYKNKAYLEIEILFIPFSFRIGIQNKTWFHIQWVEGGILWRKFKHWIKGEKGMPF